ncbi:MAG TPA: mechanosensitive ion channel family protein [Chitinophaga sp.]|uniref:mechanosensitive ion channel family protein n=1 Tax=Chitinophaga sp. TaxID=1869181 RepID=UPI002B7B08E3|nr:mechanosensitive ion channel family protein [Chitinophaga sp.]HVI43456.1 mechanosensitive ion channel family protein [Chitinophaga sp.]
MMVTEKTYKNVSRRVRILLLVRLVIYLVVGYFAVEHPALYDNFPFLGRLSNAVLFFLGANVVISTGWLIIFYWYNRRHRIKPIEKDNFLLGINRISTVLNTIFFMLAIPMLFGLRLTDFITSIAIVAAAIALLTKDYITNMINGLIIMFSDQLSLGDHVKTGDYKGKIMDITLFNVVLQNDDDDLVLIPNSVIFATVVLNQSKQNIRKITIEFELDHKLRFAPDRLDERLRRAISPWEDKYLHESFSLKTIEIKKDFAQFKVQLQLPHADKETERQIKRALNKEIIAIAESGV